MKRLALLLSAALLSHASLFAANGDPYEELAAKLSSMAGRKLSEKKIAVLNFDYVDGRASSGGRAVAEKLTNRFVELGEFVVIERGMVEKVLGELEFQNKGGVDSEAAKKLGKGLGVEAIVTGTLSDASYGNVEINARVIKAETYEIVAAATAKVKKTWSEQYAEPAQDGSPVMASAPSRPSGPRNVKGFFDLMLGFGTATMDAEFSNPSQGQGPSDLGIPFPGGFIRTVSGTGLTTGASTPIGMRVGGFGRLFGGDAEFGMFSHSTDRQRTPVSFSGINLNVTLPEDFLTVQTMHFSGDVMMRFPTGEQVIPYFGLGMGLSINNVTSSYVRMGSTLAPLNQTVPGFLFRMPFGVRFHLNDKLALFGEGRLWLNTFTFDREYSGETDTITMRGFQFLTGVGFLF